MKLTLKQWLGVRQITQNEFASRIGVTRATANKYVNGASMPGLSVAMTIADVLRITPEQIEWNPDKLGEVK